MEEIKIVKQLTLKDIIEKKMEFCLKNNIFDRNECVNVDEGELKAYKQILEDIEIYTANEFLDKYISILKSINESFEARESKSDEEIEWLSGFNNAIVNVIKLIDPIYEYKLD